MKKKTMRTASLFMAAAMVLSLTACGQNGGVIRPLTDRHREEQANRGVRTDREAQPQNSREIRAVRSFISLQV